MRRLSPQWCVTVGAVIAFWPVWIWYVRRFGDWTGEVWGLVGAPAFAHEVTGILCFMVGTGAVLVAAPRCVRTG